MFWSVPDRFLNKTNGAPAGFAQNPKQKAEIHDPGGRCGCDGGSSSLWWKGKQLENGRKSAVVERSITSHLEQLLSCRRRLAAALFCFLPPRPPVGRGSARLAGIRPRTWPPHLLTDPLDGAVQKEEPHQRGQTILWHEWIQLESVHQRTRIRNSLNINMKYIRNVPVSCWFIARLSLKPESPSFPTTLNFVAHVTCCSDNKSTILKYYWNVHAYMFMFIF